MNERDLATIGGQVIQLLSIQGVDDNGYADVGNAFHGLCGIYNPHHLSKSISFNEQGINLLKFALKNLDHISYTSCIIIETAGAKLLVSLFNGCVPEGAPFCVQDLSGFADTFILVSGVVSRGKNCGADLLKQVVDTVEKSGVDAPILVQAGCLYAGDFLYAEDETIDKNVKFYSDLGFRDVNKVIGGYENSVSMIKCSDALYESIMQFAK